MGLSDARWIAMPAHLRGSAGPLLRRSFAVDAPVESATLRICGLGFHEARLNGRRVGDHVLDPAQTDYDLRCLYVTHDVSGLLRTGANVIGVMLGDGWFNQDRVWRNRVRNGVSYGPPRLLAELRILCADGTELVLRTDQKWRCATGPITSSNVYAGERYDARLEEQGWDTSDFDDAHWAPADTVSPPGGRLQEQEMPPVRAVEEIGPVGITTVGQARHVVDMGQNFAGWARIRLSAPAGTTVGLRFAETLGPDGMIDTASTGVFATGVEQTDTYICRGNGIETWEPRFTYHGFRYVEVRGWPGVPTHDDITGVVVHTDLPRAGTFECSDARLNRLRSETRTSSARTRSITTRACDSGRSISTT